MLMIERKQGESIRINDDITINILVTRAGAVKIGVDAPKEIRVYREEIYNRIKAERSSKPK
ncbi:carbon storage regulator CsrA [Pseudomonas qingdaonensis]|uniref:carbon storage regulator CsrA n=1 Tax=Pseudomonas qingdaonensis TaxID=2056231 RepID=UPI0026604D17|nr:carbon storage regulator CsrA [Pseudomonas qingdaonensis]WKL67252.1 carbon storage regulator CsrA [Pseudomonas qingdaonensis]